ncbi:Rhodanese-related sulfurtransferase [Halogranum amylolyticum]|uniref:Rhodanese-related sulfurtransferase n=1 Tax=Halogranum amylolyticum TaxID=660520 RepID=A0A1H8V4L9_9EURY|nr:rhodanese-like domain-containing protein [Halogranum amylolyticum]SEP10177.1 Rhodanese-related sulfurtransferase [Halogranum amylolyticum]
MSKVGPARLAELQSARDVFVLDIRPEADYQREQIEGSYNAPVYHDLQQGHSDALEPHLKALPEDAEIVTVCKAGVVARRATSYLESKGYEATTLSGGYTGWRHYEKNTLLYRIASFIGKLRP